MIEVQAAQILGYLQLQEGNTPLARQNARIGPLIKDLHNTLDFDHNADLDVVLERQARAMNKAFCRLLLDADHIYENHNQCDARPEIYACLQSAGAFPPLSRFLQPFEKLKKPDSQIPERTEGLTIMLLTSLRGEAKRRRGNPACNSGLLQGYALRNDKEKGKP